MCHARNAEDAAWCTQCFERFAPASPGPAAGDGTARTGHPDPPSAGPPSPPAEGTGAEAAEAGSTGRDVRVTGAAVEWRCSTCGAWSPLESAACVGCASPRVGFGPVSAPDRAGGQGGVGLGGALVASTLLPGLGHLLRGAVGTGLGRLLLWVLWGGGGLALVATGGLSAAALVLLLAALALWAVTLIDLQRAVEGRPPIATARVLAWSVVVVTLLLVGVVLATSIGGGPQ